MLRLSKAGEALRPKIRALEQRADLPPCALGDDERARLGHRLQAGGDVRGLADNPTLLRGARADQVADHNEAASNAEAHVHWLGRGESADGIDDGEPGADRPLGIVLVRLRVAKINEHAIAHIFGDKAREPGDRVGDTAVVGADQLAQILGIIARRQRRRADQIAEHHGELAAFGIGRSRCSGDCHCDRGGGRRVAERGDSVEQTAPVADRCNTNFPEIFRCQLRQHLPIDLVLAEGRRIALKTQTLQPHLYVHEVILGSTGEGAPLLGYRSARRHASGSAE